MTNITVVGNLTSAPELRFIPSGDAVINFTVASTPRTFDKKTEKWVDGEPLFLRCSLWREAAENVAESLEKGTRVIVTGKLKQRSYEKDGQTRQSLELEVDEIGPSLKYAQAKVSKRSKADWGKDAPAGGFKRAAEDPWGAADDSAPPF